MYLRTIDARAASAPERLPTARSCPASGWAAGVVDGVSTIGRCQRTRSGLTLVELLIAISIMVMVAAALAGLSRAVELGAQYGDGRSEATQHARVILERICRSVEEATANDQFPGALVVAEHVGQWRFPDVLVVWHPTGAAADPDGLPRFSELVIYCPNPNAPNELLEITAPNDTRTVPPVDAAAQWQAEIAALRSAVPLEAVPLTTLLRTCPLPESGDPLGRGAVRFEIRLRPSEADWNAYKAGTKKWAKLAWAQGIHGASTGLRQTWVRMELQLMPGQRTADEDPDGQQAIPFFGSAALYYEMHQ